MTAEVLVLTAKPMVAVEDDAIWLERLVYQWRDSTKAAAEAAIEIARNWVDGRQVGRFYPETTAYEFLMDHMGATRLPREDRNTFIVKLIESGMSQRKAAKLAGVNNATASRVANATPRQRKPRPEPTEAQRIAKNIDSILSSASRATVLADLPAYLADDPDDEGLALISHALDRLVARVDALREALNGI